MNRTSCITHPPKQAIAIVREDYYKLMEHDAVAAALLNIFEYWANAALAANPTEVRPCLGARPIREFEQLLLGIATDKQIRKRLTLLAERGFIQMKRSVRRGFATIYRLMVPEVRSALAASGRTTDGLSNLDTTGQTTQASTVIRPQTLRSNDRTLKKKPKEHKREERENEELFSFEAKDQNNTSAQTNDSLVEAVRIGSVTYNQAPETIDLSTLWERDSLAAKEKVQSIAPRHRRPSMVAHGFGHWWVGPEINDFDPQLVQACQQRKRKCQQPDSEADAKTYLNNMLRKEDWGNFALRCEEARALKRRKQEIEQAQAPLAATAAKPIEWPEEERRASLLGLIRFKLKCGDVERAKAIAQQIGLLTCSPSPQRDEHVKVGKKSRSVPRVIGES